MSGRVPRKFSVRHYARGELPDEDVFVLVPKRDPAAVAALRAYASSTPDAALASDLLRWADTISPALSRSEPALATLARVRVWTGALAEEVREGRMPVETALQRIAGHAIDATRRELGASGLEPESTDEEAP